MERREHYKAGLSITTGTGNVCVRWGETKTVIRWSRLDGKTHRVLIVRPAAEEAKSQ